jgi:hypothetical protein
MDYRGHTREIKERKTKKPSGTDWINSANCNTAENIDSESEMLYFEISKEYIKNKFGSNWIMKKEKVKMRQEVTQCLSVEWVSDVKDR